MNSRENIGLYGTICLICIAMINKVFYTSLAGICETGGTAAWYITLISCVTSLFFFYLFCILLKRFPGKNIGDIAEIVFGKYVGKFINIILVLFTLFYSASAIREFVGMIKVYNLPNTPISMILGTFLLLAALISYFGLEVLIRICSLCFVPIILGILVILVLAYPSYDINFLKPIGGYGVKNSIVTGILRSSAYIEVATLGVYINFMHGIKNIKKAGTVSILITGAIFSISTACYLMLFTYTVGSDNLSGLFELSRSIYYNRFFQRMESIFLFIWIISTFIFVSNGFYLTTVIYAQTFKIKNHRPLIFPFLFLCFLIAILPKNISELLTYYVKPLRKYSMFLIFVFPGITLLIAMILRKKGALPGAKET